MKIKYILLTAMCVAKLSAWSRFELDDFNAKEAALESAKNNLFMNPLMAQKRDIARNLWEPFGMIKSDQEAMVEALQSDEFKKLSPNEQKALTDNYAQYQKAEKAYYSILMVFVLNAC